MKVHLAILANMLFWSALSLGPLTDQKGYDLSACSPSTFYASHVLLVGNDLKLDLMNEEPGVVEKVQTELIYKFQSEDKDGRHYLYVTKNGDKLDLVLNFDKEVGRFVVNEKLTAIVFIVEDSSGEQLSANAMKSLKYCVDLIAESKYTVPSKTSW
jgi:hypothetical protein